MREGVGLGGWRFFLECRVVIRAMFKGGEVGVMFKDESVCVVC